MDDSTPRLFFPEIAAGGFSHVDGTIEFYNRVNALLSKNMIVVDFGAGRGAAAEFDNVPYRRQLRTLKKKVSRVIGMDIDAIVNQNRLVDESIVLEPSTRIPLPDESVDIVVSDYTLEHVDEPDFVAKEMARILRPGGWICARTPNRWGYVGVAANLIPNRFHIAMLRRLQPNRNAIDVFPTRYLMNTKNVIAKYFPGDRFEQCIYTMNSEPAYFSQSKIMWFLMLAYFKIVPRCLNTTLFIFLRKR